MQRLALFDLDDTLVDRRAAFTAWAAEFVVDHDLDPGALTWLLDADARSLDTQGPLFESIRHQSALEQPAADLWQQYRRRMPELVRCRPEDLDALRRLRSAGCDPPAGASGS
jgi:putative hydrolase of the HAD superfamily